MEGGFSEADADALDDHLVEIVKHVFEEFKHVSSGMCDYLHYL